MQGEGCCFVLRFFIVITVSAFIIISVFSDYFSERKNISVLEDIVEMIRLFRNEISFRKSDVNELLQCAQKRAFSYISFDDNKICLCGIKDEEIKEEFESFVNKIGTTDAEGQLNICNEEINVFEAMLCKHKEKETVKRNVNLSLSLLGAVCIIIIFI